ncbi:radical SAM protein [Shewanella sp. Choline-02u-19]|uniref:radical SAM protein n=1 Tax=unclassified Shewanella TaxID=196818 RepID=UPI000C3267BF|nr:MULTISPECIES: radical SAM protein [unclassified Shewanella]PKG56744.1 radical SAM protein [Shewanella sp. GutDb-MelDb]PKG74441.1 radical SAM protein [Shewanella sp. GutCb]PKH57853.1 radical SAM protein [Shewanella sp. Bg11-22]PKI30351.1 radical SAM protein [Shewanella sp. Choline-02u-19]
MLNYIEPVFRPPSEWKSLILQVTNGCSWNQCSFCDMYTANQKRFRAQKIDKVEQDIVAVSSSKAHISRVFLADGDAMTLPFSRLEEICLLIKKHLPAVTRISSYCLPRNINNKTPEQLQRLKELGLSLLYIGCESGDDEVLRRIKKGETFASSLAALQKIKAAGIKSSVMILNGLGGVSLSVQHAQQSAKLMNEAQPEFLSTLVVTLPLGTERMDEAFDGHFQLPNQLQLFEEMRVLLSNLELNKTIFRSDHASNYLVLKGVLGKDKLALLSQVEAAVNTPERIQLRQEWQRGL